MPLTIEELLINLGVDVSGFKQNLAQAEQSLNGVAVAGDRVSTSLAGIEDVSGRLEGSLTPVQTVATDVAQSVGKIGDASRRITFTELGRGAAAAALNIRDIGTATIVASTGLDKTASAANLTDAQLRKVNVSGAQLGKNLALIALHGGTSAEKIFSIAKATAELASVSARTSVLGQFLRADLANIGSSALRLTPTILALGAGFTVFQTQMSLANESLEREKTRLDAFTKTATDALAKLNQETDDLKFEASIAGLSDFDQATERSRRSVNQLAEAVRSTDAVFSQGLEEGINAERLTAQIDDATKKLSVESRIAGDALRDNIRAGVDAAIVEIDKLKTSINVKPAAETLESLRALGSELDFTGPIGDLQKLQDALDDAAAKITAAGKQAGLEPAFIASQIAEAQKRIKTAFQQELQVRIHVDPQAAEAEVARLGDLFKSNVVTLTPQVEMQQLTAELDTIRARIADTPEGEFQIALKAKADELEAKLDEVRSKAEQPVTVPVNADTTEAEQAFADFRAQLNQQVEDTRSRLGLGVTNDQLNSLSIAGGPTAGAPEILAAAQAFAAGATEALQAGDKAQLQAIAAQGQQFLATFKASFDFLKSLGENLSTRMNDQSLGIIQAVVSRALQGITGGLATPGALAPQIGGTPGITAINFAPVTDTLEQTNSILRDSNATAKASLDAAQDLSTSLQSNAYAANTLTKQQSAVRAARGGLLGG